MPLFEYHCRDCETSFEKLTRYELADSVACPECGGNRARRLLSMFASFSQTSSTGSAPVATMGGGGGCCGGACGCGGH
jgi:putative FmdB family regulatory protein